MSNRHFTLTDVTVVAPSSVRLTFADGEQLSVDLTEITRHAILSP